MMTGYEQPAKASKEAVPQSMSTAKRRDCADEITTLVHSNCSSGRPQFPKRKNMLGRSWPTTDGRNR